MYRIYTFRKDTAKIIESAEKRLFIYNSIGCGTGEREFKMELFDSLIKYYGLLGQTDKVNELKLLRIKYRDKNKLRKPHYL
jgi:hypothetical protein